MTSPSSSPDESIPKRPADAERSILNDLRQYSPIEAEELQDLQSVVRDLLGAGQAIREGEPPHDLTVSAVESEWPEPAEFDLKQLGDFWIRGEIGRGGMGIVYEAEQISLSRRVALKVLPQASLMSKKQLKRFQREARAAAALEHPNIVRAYSVGSESGVHFLAMQLVDGPDWSRVIRRLRDVGYYRWERPVADDSTSGPSSDFTGSSLSSSDPRRTAAKVNDLGFETSSPLDDSSSGKPSPDSLDPVTSTTETKWGSRDYFELVAQVGMQASEALVHAHRAGVIHRDIKPSNLLFDPRGIVLVTDFGLAQLGATHDLTATGDVMGTMRYMSPEQASGQPSLDARSDVYSLGATLYEMVTLRAAHPTQDRAALLRNVLEDDPLPPHQLSAGVPRDLEAIILKAMAKEPRHRYPSALEMAADLQRFLRGEPVLAKPASWVGRVGKWIKRNRTVAGLTLVIFLLLCSLAAGLAFHNQQLENLVTRLNNTGKQLTNSLSVAQRAEADTRQLLYVADIREANRAARLGEYQRVRELLHRHRPSGGEQPQLEWRLLNHIVPRELHQWTIGNTPVIKAALAPDTTYWVSGDKQGRIRFWSLEPLSNPESSSPAQANAGREFPRLPPHPGEIHAVTFSPDGRYLAVAGARGLIRVWSTQDWQLEHLWAGHTMTVTELMFRPDNRTLISSSRDSFVRLWDVDAGHLLHSFTTDTTNTTAAISPDGTLLATGGSDQRVQLWSLPDGESLANHEGYGDTILALAFSPDGSLLASGSYGREVLLHDTRSHELVDVQDSRSGIRSLDFYDDAFLLAGSMDEEVCGWALDENRQLTETRIVAGDQHTPIRSIQAIPEREQFLAVAESGVAKLWSQPPNGLRGRVAPTVPDPREIHTLGDDDFLIVDRNGLASFQPATLEHRTLAESEGLPSLVELPDGGQRIATAQRNRFVVRTLREGTEEKWEVDCGSHVHGLWLSPTGRWLVVGGWDDLAVWSVESKSLQGKLPLPRCTQVAFHPGETCFAAGTANEDYVEVVDPATLTRIRICDACEHAVCFSPDGQFLATAGYDRMVRLWRCSDWELEHAWSGHEDTIRGLVFDGLGERLVSVGEDIRLWHLPTRQFLFSLHPSSPSHVSCADVSLSRDDRFLTVICEGRTRDTSLAYTWDLQSE